MSFLPCGTMAAVESTSVTSVLRYDWCKHFALLGGLCEKLEGTSAISVPVFDWCDHTMLLGGLIVNVGHHLESSLTSQRMTLSSLQNTGHVREVGALDRRRQSEQAHRVDPVTSRRSRARPRARTGLCGRSYGLLGSVSWEVKLQA